jgi:hypothetical protein
MTNIRRRFKQSTSLHARLAMFAQEVRDKAASLPPENDNERRELLRKAQQAEVASHIDEVIGLPGTAPK